MLADCAATEECLYAAHVIISRWEFTGRDGKINPQQSTGRIKLN